MVHLEFGQDRLAQANPLQAVEGLLYRGATQVLRLGRFRIRNAESSSSSSDELRTRLLDFLIRLLHRVTSFSLGVGIRVASLNGLAEALRAGKIGESTAREFVVDVKSRNALAQGLEGRAGALKIGDSYAALP